MLSTRDSTLSTNVMALEFSPETLKKFEETVARYPKKEAAMLPVLYLAQQEFGCLSPEAIEYVATLMEQAPALLAAVEKAVGEVV